MSPREQVKQAALDERTELNIRAIAGSDLRNKLVTRELEVADLGTTRRLWNRIMGHSDYGEILEAAHRLQKLSEREGLSDHQRDLIEAAKLKVRALAESLSGRRDLRNTVIAQFDGSKEEECLSTGTQLESAGLLTYDSGGALHQDSTKPSHHPSAFFNGDRAEGAYFDNGSLALVACDAAPEADVGNMWCAMETAATFLEELKKVHISRDLDWRSLKQIFVRTEALIRQGYTGMRKEIEGRAISMGKTALAAVRTFPTADPLRVDVKVVQLGYVVVLYRNRLTGKIFPLTRTERGVAQELQRDEQFHDSTALLFDPSVDIGTYWDNVHFNEALVPVEGDFIVLTDGYADNLLDYQTLELVCQCAVFDHEIAGPTPWVTLPSARQLRKYNEANGHRLDDASAVSPEQITQRLYRYVRLLTKNRRELTEEIDELADQRQLLVDQAEREEELRTTEKEMDKLLEDLEGVVGCLGDCLVTVCPVMLPSAENRVNALSKTISTLFG